MTTRHLVRRHLLPAMAAALLLAVAAAPAAPDFGDYTSATLTTKAWQALGSKAGDDAIVYIDKCIELYGAEAKKMQAGLTAYPSNDPKEETFKFWALNDVGTCCFIKGEVLMQKGDKKGAKAAYERVANEFSYAQCWDTKGWFWKPADAARQKIAELKFDEQ